MRRFFAAYLVITIYCSGTLTPFCAQEYIATRRDPFQRPSSQPPPAMTTNTMVTKAKAGARKKLRPPVIVVTAPPVVDYLSGAAQVTVTGSSQQLRLAMAQYGSTMIEVPENDQIYGVFEGSPELATVDQETLKKTKKFIIVRPGKSFVVSPPAPPTSPPTKSLTKTPSVSVTIQTRSGLVLTFLFYPVADLAINAHHVTLRYNRDVVISNRQREGLATNLVRDEVEQIPAVAASQMPASIITTSTSSATAGKDSPTPEVSTLPGASPPRRTDLGIPQAPTLQRSRKSTKSESDILKATKDAVRQATKLPSQFSRWSEPVHGLSLSLSAVRALDAETNIVVFAVRNTLELTVRLLPESPDLVVDTLDDKGKRMMTDTVVKITSESSTAVETLPAKAIVYFAVAYRAPILGAHQQLRISLAQRNASDEPSSLDLNTAAQ